MKAALCLGLAMAAIVVGPSAHGQSFQGHLATFETYPVGHTFAMNSYVSSLVIPKEYLIDDFNLPGTPSATVADVGGELGHVLTLSGGARLVFERGIWVTNARVDVGPNSAFGYLALDTHLYELDDVLATSSGILETGASRWAYNVLPLGNGFSRISLGHEPFSLAGKADPQFAVIARGTLQVDNVDVFVFPEPPTGALAGIMLAAGALTRRRQRPLLRVAEPKRCVTRS